MSKWIPIFQQKNDNGILLFYDFRFGLPFESYIYLAADVALIKSSSVCLNHSVCFGESRLVCFPAVLDGFNQHYQVFVHFPITSTVDNCQQHQKKFLWTSRIKPGVAGWEARILPLCFSAPLFWNVNCIKICSVEIEWLMSHWTVATLGWSQLVHLKQQG